MQPTQVQRDVLKTNVTSNVSLMLLQHIILFCTSNINVVADTAMFPSLLLCTLHQNHICSLYLFVYIWSLCIQAYMAGARNMPLSQLFKMCFKMSFESIWNKKCMR